MEGRLIMFDLEEDGQFVTIVAIYAPNSDSPDFFRKIREDVKNRYDHKIIVGDFNLTLDVELDRLNTYSNNNKAKTEVENLMDEFHLKDVWRIQNGERREYSWRKRGDIQKASRIDFTLVSAGLDQKVEAIQYIPGIKTDHRALYFLVELKPFERGKGYWKFNSKLLHNQEYLNLMNQHIQHTLQTCSRDKSSQEKWEYLKTRIISKTKEFARKISAEDKLIIAQLSEKVNEYETSMPLNEEDDRLLYESKIELEEKLIERVKGIMFRSKVKWYEEGEKNTKYFLALEKARYNNKTCFKIFNAEQEEVSDPIKILQIQEKFYSDLYSADKNVKFNWVNTFGIKVPEHIREQQNQQIKMEELGQATKSMSNNKTPGEDGIPVDFYKVFWNVLKQPFYNMVLEVYENNCLHESARKGILNLIPKAGKDPRHIKNLRPITLLNTDYKIIEKVIAMKMVPALTQIINKDQRGFMKDRRISVNIRKMLDILYITEVEDLEAVVLSMDFVKCFDKCSFSILHGSLVFFGFGDIIKKWTKILYKDFTVKIQNNGYFSSPIEIHKGVHQGGCCSSVYFLVIAEILALALRNNHKVQGITIREIHHLLDQFADDMDIFSNAQEESIKAILEELDRFKLQSGFMVSYDKTTMYRIGSLRHSQATLYDITQFTWSNTDINVLGITITYEDIMKKNYDRIIEKTKKVTSAWYNRNLTLMGRIQVINTLVASLFVYPMMVLPQIPDYIVKKMDCIVRNFLWKGKKAKIAYKILQNPNSLEV